MSDDKTPDDYEVGYGKPPKHTRFQNGASGNPKGRPKKSLDSDHVLIKESIALIGINDNGRRSRISKHAGAIKQLINKAMTGNIQALRLYLGLLQQAHERVALVAAPQPNNSGKHDDVRNLTDEELMMIIIAGEKKQNK